MTKKLLYGLLIVVLLTLSLFAACTSTTSSTSTSSQTSTSITQTATSTESSVTTSITTTANWWDKDGTPQYGGTINIPTYRIGSLEEGWDPYNAQNFSAGWFDDLFSYDWTLDRSVFSFQAGWVPDQYMKSSLAETWEWTDAQTMVLHIQQGIYWQDKEPVNGREFTAHDVVYHFDRLFGTGSGFTIPSPTYISYSNFKSFEATDDYTVVIHFKNPTQLINMWTIMDPIISHISDAKEWVEQIETKDWKSVVGTGPFTVTDFVSGSSMTLTRNPNYWGKDERYPENQIPYVDEVKMLSIPDISTEVAALRTGKIDYLTELNQTQEQALVETNPEINIAPLTSWSETIVFRVDKEPFSDIRVRQAMELAIDRGEIASSLYGTSDETYGVVVPTYDGYTYAYEDWSEDLTAEYTYNPTKAKKLLAEAGYADGFSVTYYTPIGGDSSLEQVFKAYLHEIGVEVEINVMQPSAIFPLIRNRKHDGIVANGGGIGTAPLSTLQGATSANFNAACHTDTNFDALVTKIMNALSSEEAMQYSTEASKYFLEQHWQIAPISVTQYNVWQPYLKGYNGEGGPCLYSCRGWFYAHYWIDQNLKKSM